jgi:hypothetical protein
LPHHKLWYNDNSEFPKVESKLVIAFNDELKINKNYNEMNELQNELLNMTVHYVGNLCNYFPENLTRVQLMHNFYYQMRAN